MPTRIELRRRAFCQILIDGTDVTSNLEPHLISVNVIDTMSESDRCAIELDDRDGKLPIPENNKDIIVRLGWAGSGPPANVVGATAGGGGGGELGWEGTGLKRVFVGGVSSVESGFARRGGGRRLWVEGSSMFLLDKGKEAMNKTWGDGDLQDHLKQALEGKSSGGFSSPSSEGSGGSGGSEGQPSGGGIPLKKVLEEAAKAAGYNMKISPAFSQITRDFWHQNKESFHNFGQRLARELGGIFKIQGKDALLNSLNDGKDIEGKDRKVIDATWGFNLISWRIKPWSNRPDYKSGKNQWYNIFKGQWEDVVGQLGDKSGFGSGLQAPFGKGTASLFLPAPAPNRQVSEQRNGGSASDVNANRGTGWVVINGEPEAQARALIMIQGARPGVDGQYSIKEAEHHYTRNGGYTTRCVLDRPSYYEGYKDFVPQPGQ